METPRPASRFNFSILGLLGLTTFAAVVTVLMVKLPAVGIIVLVLTAAPLGRTYLEVRRARIQGQPFTLYEMLLYTMAGTGILVLAILTGGIAMYATCTAFVAASIVFGASGFFFAIGLIAGAIFGVVAMAKMLRWGWPKDREFAKSPSTSDETKRE